MEDYAAMSEKYKKRIEIIPMLDSRRIDQKDAAGRLNLSVRQVQRLIKEYREKGLDALLPKKVKRVPHNKFSDEFKNLIVEIITRDIYSGFKPQLMMEKLDELHGIPISREALRQIMIEHGLHTTKNKKGPAVHQLRPRRSRFGELVQIDGSPHAWFEDRGDPCDLIDFIDDATGQILAMRFFPSETTNGYFIVSHQHITKHGRPLAYYSDKDSIFRLNQKRASEGKGITEFTRAMKELEIGTICANSPQAKGRVERAHRTLQDRLIKEMRLRGISTMEEGNAFLDEFIETYNKKFAKRPKSKHDAHRPLDRGTNLDYILAKRAKRCLSKNLTLSYKRVVYQLQVDKPTWKMRKSNVDVVESPNGEISIYLEGKEMKYTVYDEHIQQPSVVGSKQLEQKIVEIEKFLKEKQTEKPDKSHPYKRGRYTERVPSESEELEAEERMKRRRDQERIENIEIYLTSSEREMLRRLK